MKSLKINAVLCFVFLSLWSSLGQADTQFRVIVDASGSMQTSDPDKITAQALQLISDLAPEQKATLGVWLFGEQPRVLFPESLITPSSKAKLARYVSTYTTEDLKTDLESILLMLLKTPDTPGLAPGYRRDWILVTDGMVDVSLDDAVNNDSRERIWGEITQQLEQRNIHLHTISLTGYTDDALLDHLSFRTNASHTQVAVPDDLLDTFDRIFSQASPAEELPLEEGGYLLDQSINEVTFEVLHGAGELPNIVQPNGESLALVDRPGVHVADAAYYTLVTVTKPQVGEWRVENANPKRTQVRVLSNAVAKATSIPSLVFTKESIESNVALFQNGEELKSPDQLSAFNADQTLFYMAGGTKLQVLNHTMAHSGARFKSRIEGITRSGLYELVSTVKGEGYARQLRQYFTVQPPVLFDVKNNGANLVTFSATPSNAKLKAASSTVTLRLSYADGTQQVDVMPFIGQGYWQKVVPISAGSFVKASASVTGNTQAGESITYKTPIWTIERMGSGAVSIQQGDLTPQQDLPSSSQGVATSQVVTALNIQPDVDLVKSQETQDQDAANTAEQAPSKDLVADVAKEVESVIQASWFIYALIGVIALFVILLVLVFTRRSKPSGRYDSEDVDDV